MARVTKDADVRREELLDVALELCVSDGFKRMSVEQITTKAGVAKGTFYHYFVSKQDLLAQLVDRFGDELFTYLETQMAAVEGDAPSRLRALMGFSAGWKSERLDAAATYIPFLYKEENYSLRHRLWSAWLERTRPLLLAIVARGAEEGTFHVDDPDATTSVILALWFDATNRLFERALATGDDEAYGDTLARGLTALWGAEERILGVEAGTLSVPVDPKLLMSTRAMFQTDSITDETRA